MANTALDDKFKFVAGEVVLDLVNTVHWRLNRERWYDALENHAHLLRWCELTGVITPGEAARLEQNRDENAVQAVKRIREAAYAALYRPGPGLTPDPGKVLTQAFGQAQRRASLQNAEAGWHWADNALTSTTPVDRLARAAVALITRQPQPSLGQCADDDCGWVFIDTSRRHNRRWCEASTCGDRNRARQYYQRQREE